jgi:uncharacterized protein (TIGR02996 family)
MTTEDDFQKQLDAHPDDDHTRLVFADWLQERADPRADGYRALGVGSKRPRPDWQESGAKRRFFTWFKREKQSDRKYHPNSLPGDWFLRLKGGKQFSDDGTAVTSKDRYILGDWTDYPSRREAEDAAALAFAKLPPEVRAELLAGPAERPATRRKKPARKPKPKAKLKPKPKPKPKPK